MELRLFLKYNLNILRIEEKMINVRTSLHSLLFVMVAVHTGDYEIQDNCIP